MVFMIIIMKKYIKLAKTKLFYSVYITIEIWKKVHFSTDICPCRQHSVIGEISVLKLQKLTPENPSFLWGHIKYVAQFSGAPDCSVVSQLNNFNWMENSVGWHFLIEKNKKI